MKTDQAALSPARIVLTIVYLLLYPAVMMLLAGDWLWVEGWLFNLWFIGVCVTTIVYLYRKDPALLRERYRMPGTGNEQKWDRYFVYALGIAFLAWIVVMPLDAERYRWTTGFPVWPRIAGGALMAVSFFFFFRSFADNTFASPLVRIQTERRQRVVSTGVYGFVRHPLYLGAVLLFIGAPLLLGSLYGLILGALLSLMLVGRIAGEEKMLLAGLEGYAEYRQKVRYRLIPHVW